MKELIIPYPRKELVNVAARLDPPLIIFQLFCDNKYSLRINQIAEK